MLDACLPILWQFRFKGSIERESSTLIDFLGLIWRSRFQSQKVAFLLQKWMLLGISQMPFSRFEWWTMPLWRGKEEKERVFNGSLPHSSSNYGYGFGIREPDTVKFPLKGTRVASSSSSSSRKIKKKRQSREERKHDREHDVVVVPADGFCLSVSESDDSDWSIGWLEPHGPDFLSDDETDDSFAVLVPCYKNERRGLVDGTNNQLLNAIKNLTNEHFSEGNNMMEQWLSSLQNF